MDVNNSVLIVSVSSIEFIEKYQRNEKIYPEPHWNFYRVWVQYTRFYTSKSSS